MPSSVTVKTTKIFHCPKIDTEVGIEYCTGLKYLGGPASDIREILINPDCERKTRCGIACQKDGKAVYDWSLCANPELRTAGRQTGWI
jgi:hypothetical protein